MDIIEINRRQVFTLEEAQEVLPIIYRFTKLYSEKVRTLIERIESLSGRNEELVTSLENQVNEIVQEWQSKVQKLGALPKGLWIADFDSGDGYFCWKYPERAIDFWHRYNDGYSKRVSLLEKRKPVSLHERLQRRLSQKIFSLSPITLQPTD